MARKKKKEVPVNDIPEIKKQILSPRVEVIEPQRVPTYLWSAVEGPGGRRSVFRLGEYDLAEIGRAEDTEAYLAQTFIKKIGLMFKAGYSFVGKNPNTIEYVKNRFRQIAAASGTSIDQLLRSLGSSLIKKSNSFLIKVRNEKASGGRSRSLPGSQKVISPVAAYFTSPAETMRFRLDEKCTSIIRWEHYLGEDKKKDFDPLDIVHITYNKKDGFVLGTPIVVPVLDDIRALRKIEENVELLIYQHLFPLFQYVVGTENRPAGFTEDGRDEIEVVKNELKKMPTEGGIVTPERHSIKAVGSEGRALRAESYLDYFKKRVFAGLGTSAVDHGEGETANRATSTTMSRNMVDSVKDFQAQLEIQFRDQIIMELLLESDFMGIDPLAEENMVSLKFNEIDIDSQIKLEEHLVDQFAKQAITHTELRNRIGLEPIKVPTAKEAWGDQWLDDRYPEWYQTEWKLFQEPKLLIQALDEPYSAESRAAAANRSLELGQADLDAGQQGQQEAEKRAAEQKIAIEKAKPKPVSKRDFLEDRRRHLLPHLPRPYPTKQRYSQQWWQKIVLTRYDQMSEVILDQIKLGLLEKYYRPGGHNETWLRAKYRVVMEPAKAELFSEMRADFFKEYSTLSLNRQAMEHAFLQRRGIMRTHAETSLSRLEDDVLAQLDKFVIHARENGEPIETLLQNTRTVFDSLRYRANFIDRTTPRVSEVMGQGKAYEDIGVLELRIVTHPGECELCQQRNNMIVSSAIVGLHLLPPFHPNCNCEIVPK